jgi:hypothetical protein
MTGWRGEVKVPRTHATPTPFGPARAEEIWEARGAEQDFSHAMTDGEDEYVRKVWETMPGWTCYMDAFNRIWRGV